MDDSYNIYSLTNKEIVVADNFAGQSFTLKNENGALYVIRKIFGSGRPVVASVKYKAILQSKYQVTFSNPVEITPAAFSVNKNESFTLETTGNNSIKIFINGIQIVIVNK